jgi:hypothetical protein
MRRFITVKPRLKYENVAPFYNQPLPAIGELLEVKDLHSETTQLVAVTRIDPERNVFDCEHVSRMYNL